MTVSEIKNKLRPGDNELIAEIVGCAAITVYQILKGDSNHKTYRGERIIAVATRMISHRNELKQEYNIAS